MSHQTSDDTPTISSTHQAPSYNERSDCDASEPTSEPLAPISREATSKPIHISKLVLLAGKIVEHGLGVDATTSVDENIETTWEGLVSPTIAESITTASTLPVSETNDTDAVSQSFRLPDAAIDASETDFVSYDPPSPQDQNELPILSISKTPDQLKRLEDLIRGVALFQDLDAGKRAIFLNVTSEINYDVDDPFRIKDRESHDEDAAAPVRGNTIYRLELLREEYGTQPKFNHTIPCALWALDSDTFQSLNLPVSTSILGASSSGHELIA